MSSREGSAVESPLNELANVYDLPVLSVREAYADAALRGASEFAPSLLTQDGLHPWYLMNSSAPIEPAYRCEQPAYARPQCRSLPRFACIIRPCWHSNRLHAHTLPSPQISCSSLFSWSTF
eukprot:1702697-Prymnesium_polylepis.2